MKMDDERTSSSGNGVDIDIYSSSYTFPDSSLEYLLLEYEKIVGVMKHKEFGPKLKKVIEFDDQDVYDVEDEICRLDDAVRLFLTTSDTASAAPRSVKKAAHYWLHLYASKMSQSLNFQGLGATTTVDQLSIVDRLDILDTNHEKVCGELEEIRMELFERHPESVGKKKQWSENQLYFMKNVSYESLIKLPTVLVLLLARTLSWDDSEHFTGQNMNMFAFKIWRDTLHTINADEYLLSYTVMSSSTENTNKAAIKAHQKQPITDGWNAARRDEQLVKYCVFKRWAEYYEKAEQLYDREKMLNDWLQEGVDFYNQYAIRWGTRQFDADLFSAIKTTAALTWINDVVAEVSKMLDAIVIAKPESNFVEDIVQPGESREARKRWLRYFCYMIDKKRRQSRKRSIGGNHTPHHTPMFVNTNSATDEVANTTKKIAKEVVETSNNPVPEPFNNVSSTIMTTTIAEKTGTTPISAQITQKEDSTYSVVKKTASDPADRDNTSHVNTSSCMDHSFDYSFDQSIGGNEESTLYRDRKANISNSGSSCAPMTTMEWNRIHEDMVKLLAEMERKHQEMVRALMLQLLQLQGQQVAMQSEISQLRLQAQQSNLYLSQIIEWMKYNNNTQSSSTISSSLQQSQPSMQSSSTAPISTLFPSFAAAMSSAISAGSSTAGAGGTIQANGLAIGSNNTGSMDNFSALLLQQAQQQQQQQQHQQKQAISTPFVMPPLFPTQK